MPYNWTMESERAMLILALSSSDTRPAQSTWNMVAERLGGGLNGNAVSQKFYKLKRESEKLLSGDGSISTPSTPKRGKNATTQNGAGGKPTSAKGSGKRKKIDFHQSDDEADDTPIKKEAKLETEEDEGDYEQFDHNEIKSESSP